MMPELELCIAVYKKSLLVLLNNFVVGRLNHSAVLLGSVQYQHYQVLYTQVSNKKYTPIPVFLSNYQLYLSTLSFAVVCCLVFHEKHVFLEEVMPCCRPLIIGAILLHGTTTNITWMFL